MQPDTIAIMAFTGFLTTGLGALFWTRLNRIEDRLDAIAANSVTRNEFTTAVAEIRSEVGSLRSEFSSEVGSLRSEFSNEVGSLRSEVSGEIKSLRTGLSGEIASLRSDLTQIALAVGVRPRASEG